MFGRRNIHHWTMSTCEREGMPQERQRQVPQDTEGLSPEQVLKMLLFPGVLKKRRKSCNQR
jgi:hypothetical protein